MRPGALFRVAIGTLLCVGCESDPSAGREHPSEGVVVVDQRAGEISFEATFHRGNAERGTWHLIVQEGGSMAPLAFFSTDVSPGRFYEALRSIGASDGNNVNAKNMGDESIATEGDAIEFLFDGEGLDPRTRLEDLVSEFVPERTGSAEPLGLDMRFGGNYTGEDAASPPCHVSGCLSCLYTCSAGVTSNARANQALLDQERQMYRYRVKSDRGPADGTRVKITVRKKAG